MSILSDLFKIKSAGSWTAEEARSRVDYGGSNETLESATFREIKTIESKINSATFSGDRITSAIYNSRRHDITEGVKAHFVEKGFIVDIYKNQEIPDYEIMIVGW